MNADAGSFEILAGEARCLGARVIEGGVNFALFSAHAERVELCLFDETGQQEIARLELPENTHEVWHGFVPGLQPIPMRESFSERSKNPIPTFPTT